MRTRYENGRNVISMPIIIIANGTTTAIYSGKPVAGSSHRLFQSLGKLNLIVVHVPMYRCYAVLEMKFQHLIKFQINRNEKCNFRLRFIAI